MKILIAADHAGFNLKKEIIKFLNQKNILYEDLGCNNEQLSVDYPDYANLLCKKLQEGQFGILICGSGIGMCIAANRYKSIRAALCYNAQLAMLAREHNNANVLVLGSRFIDQEIAISCVESFINTKFSGGRHLQRVKKIS